MAIRLAMLEFYIGMSDAFTTRARASTCTSCRACPFQGPGAGFGGGAGGHHIIHQQHAPSGHCVPDREPGKRAAHCAAAPWRRPWRPGWAWRGCGPAPADRKTRFQSRARRARQFRRLVVAPLPEPAADAAAPARSGRIRPAAARPARPSQRAKPGTRSSRSACFRARMAPRLLLVIGQDGAGAVEGRRLGQAGGAEHSRLPAPPRNGMPQQAQPGPSRKVMRAPAVGAEAGLAHRRAAGDAERRKQQIEQPALATFRHHAR